MKKDKMTINLKAKDIIGKKVLILGEVGSGKTELAAKILEELLTFLDPKEITVIDMAPQRTGEVGGKISDRVCSINEIRYLSPEKVYTPRLTGTSCEQILKYAELNRRAIEPLLDEFIQKVSKVLIINDVTLYLHSGEVDKILSCLRMAETFLATGYHGSKLSEDMGSGISIQERRSIEELAAYMDLVIKMNDP
ncbi:MAG: helicase HerA domain-containing protein [Thermoproteota archaeon]